MVLAAQDALAVALVQRLAVDVVARMALRYIWRIHTAALGAFPAFHSISLTLRYEGRMLLALPFTRLQIPRSTRHWQIRATFPRPRSPVFLMMSSMDGPKPNRFHHSSITRNTSFCLGVICRLVRLLKDIRLTRVMLALHPSNNPITWRNYVTTFQRLNPASVFLIVFHDPIWELGYGRMIPKLEPLGSLYHYWLLTELHLHSPLAIHPAMNARPWLLFFMSTICIPVCGSLHL